jgi:hypothetical protein
MQVELDNEYCAVGYYIAVLEEPINSSHDLWYHESYKDTDEWCEQTFGAQDSWGENPVTGWKRMRNKYFFTTDASRGLFVLRWA